MTLRMGPLQSRNFRLLMSCNVISVAGSAVYYVAIPFAVLGIGGSASDVGYVAAARLIPAVAFLLLGGAIADRLPRHQVIVAANALQALAQGTSAVLLLTGHASAWALAGLAAVTGAGTGLYFPAAEGLMPQTVPENQRPQANALDRTGQNAASIGGAALGGVLVALTAPGWALAADAASYAIAGALRAGMRFPALPPLQATGLLHDLRTGWHEFTSRRWLWTIVLQFAVITAISTATISVLGPLVAHDSLGGARSWGLVVAAYSAGAVAGGMVMIRFRPQRMLLAAALSVPAWSLLLFALAVPLATPLDAAAALLTGACGEVFVVNWVTTRQQEIPQDLLSRISSYDILGRFALAPAGTLIAGPLAAAYGTTTVLTVGGILVIVLAMAVLLVPEVRQTRRCPPAPAAIIHPAPPAGSPRGRHGAG